MRRALPALTMSPGSAVVSFTASGAAQVLFGSVLANASRIFSASWCWERPWPAMLLRKRTKNCLDRRP